eukprot:gnl/Dysnectes_brevis/7220_a11911_271.p1 GENE.gnl/Dysnectes_brevis/7220_a11911_271~~gnl/Dysnectes_brevis/7220_a11911_271.p1  ORF type:complete len:364 (-),score=98.06 gnl/Dysnectes_brevis/7220_a11911_271:41-1069(-)
MKRAASPRTLRKRAKTPVSRTGASIKELSAAVKQLQSDSEQQLQIEYASQQTFEELSGQIKSLRNALGNLSEVLIAEIDSIKHTTQQSLSSLEGSISAIDTRVREQDAAIAALGLRQDQLSNNTAEMLQQRCQELDSSIEESKRGIEGIEASVNTGMAALKRAIGGTQQALDASAEELSRRISQAQADQGAATAATSQDLADITAAQRALKSQLTGLSGGLKRQQTAGNEIAVELRRQLQSARTTEQQEQKQVSRLLSGLSAKLEALEQRSSQSERAFVQDLKLLAKSQAKTAQAVSTARADASKLVKRSESSLGKRIEAISHAVGTIADIVGDRKGYVPGQ